MIEGLEPFVYFLISYLAFHWISDRTLKVWSLDGISEDSEEPINLKTRSVVAAHDKDINSVAVARNDSLVCTGSEVIRYDGQTFSDFLITIVVVTSLG